MKFIKILQKYKEASDEQIKLFIYKNMSEEMLRGLEYDDPQAIKRALKMFGISPEEIKKLDEKTKPSGAVEDEG